MLRILDRKSSVKQSLVAAQNNEAWERWKKKYYKTEPVNTNDGIITDVWQSPEKSKWKEECNVPLANFSRGVRSNQAKGPVRLKRTSILAETVNDSSFVKVWSVDLSW